LPVRTSLFHLFLLQVLVLMMAPIAAFSQENSYLNFGVAEGLPSVEVYTVIKDKKGFLWFGTDNGVVRFDGGKFEVFNLELGLVDPVVFGLHEDQMGRIWFRSFTGKLAYFYNEKIVPYRYNDSIQKFTKNAVISGLTYDSLDNLNLSINNRFIRIDSSGELSMEKINLDTLELRRFKENNLPLFAHGSATPDLKVLKVDHRYLGIEPTDNNRSTENVYYFKWNGEEYFSLNSGIYKIGNTLEKVYKASSLIIASHIDKKNKLWIGLLNKGLIRFEDSDFKKINIIEELSEKSITGILEDDEKGYWITTLEKGVYYFPNFAVKQFRLPSNSKITAVNSISNNVITSDFSGIISAFQAGTGKMTWQKKIPYPINTTFADRKNQLWASTGGGTYILDETGAILKNNLPSNLIDFTYSKNKILGLTSYRYFEFDENGNNKALKNPDSQFRNLLATDDEIYMGGKNGLYLYDLDFNLKKELSYFRDIKITNLTQVNDSIILASTTGSGLILYNKKSQQSVSYNRAHNFIANNIYSLVIHNSTLWLGTEKGISVCAIASLLKGQPEFQFITRNNGLVSDKVNFLSILKNELWAFSDEGYVKFPLSEIRYANKNPVAYLKEFIVNSDTISYSQPIELANDQNNINIKLGFLSYNNQNILTRFRLSEKDESWTVSEDWNYEFNSLAPDDYKFEVQYSTDNFVWEPTGIKLLFTIHPPWWSKLYFYLIILAFIIFIALNLYYRRVNRYKERDAYLSVINEQQKKLLTAEIEVTERERNRIANDLHDGVSTDLISINLMLKRISNKLDKEEVSEIETQLNNTISEIKSIIYDLTPPGLQFFGLSAGIQNYITIIKKNSSIDINYEFKGEELKDPHTGGIIFRIVQELITNSIKHADCSVITIHIETTQDALALHYTDNGQGFDMQKVTMGLGLSSIQSRVELLGGVIEFTSDEKGISYNIRIPLMDYKRVKSIN
jgi:signal transduction histidine kinase/ligand-binding sensor domain-containing protein